MAASAVSPKAHCTKSLLRTPLVQVVDAALALLNSPTPPHPDVRGAVYKLAVMSGRPEAFDKIWSMYKAVRGCA